MSVEIRELRPEEFDEAGRVTREAYAEFLAGRDEHAGRRYATYLEEIGDIAGRAPRTTILAAFDNGAVIGTVTLEVTGRVDPEQPAPAPDEVHIRMLGIDPQARGRGAGRALMDASLETARRLGRPRITLHTTELMQVAQGMYERMGFTRVSDEIMPWGMRLLGYELILGTVPAS